MTVAFHTLGCKTNAYETQAVMEQFKEAGFNVTDFDNVSDIYIINTCAVTQEAARKSRQIAKRCKKINPDALLVITGCYAQEAGGALAKETMADIIVGNGEKSRILPIVMERLLNKEKDSSQKNVNPQESFSSFIEDDAEIVIKDQTFLSEYEDQQINLKAQHTRAYVKIQDGCNRFCSYCIIPYLRGRARSRDKAQTLKEIASLSNNGFKEIILTGIDISSYESGLTDLIKEAGEIEGIERIRLGSLEESIITDEFLENIINVKELCPHFHLSLQSGSDAVLKRMNRHYTTEDFLRAVEKIRKYFPDAAITTDIITGFPMESDAEFEETIDFVKLIGFSRLHVFPFSRRKGTKAYSMTGQVPGKIRRQRAKQLIDIGDGLRINYEERFIGKSCEVLIEENINNELLSGYTPHYVRVNIEIERGINRATSLFGQKTPINSIVTVIPERFDSDSHELFCSLS